MIINIKRILVPVDFTETSNFALDKACRVAAKCKADLFIIHVLEGSPYRMVESDENPKEKVVVQKNIMDKLEKMGKSITENHHISVTTLVGESRVVEVIEDAVKTQKIDLIIMGTNGASGIKEVLIGSNAQHVVNGAVCPVITMKSAPSELDFSNIVLPLESWNNSLEKLDYISCFATNYKSHVHLLGIIDSKKKTDMQKVLALLGDAESYLKKLHIPSTRKIITSEHLAKETLEYADQIKANLIMVLSEHESRMGVSVPNVFVRHIVNHSEIPVMSIRPAMYQSEKVSFHKEPVHRQDHVNVSK